MKAMWSALLLSAVAAVAEPSDQELDESWNILAGELPSGDRYEAYRKLVAAGERGWQKIFDLQFNIQARETTRIVSVLWSCEEIPEEVLNRFIATQQAEEQRRLAENETWALLYVDKMISARSKAHNRYEAMPLTKEFTGLSSKQAEDPAKVLWQVASLRVSLASRADFPGHRFPWNDSAKKQRESIQAMLEWWKKEGPGIEKAEE